jgi:hypothetical protein
MLGIWADAVSVRLGSVLVVYLVVRFLLAVSGSYYVGWRVQVLSLVELDPLGCGTCAVSPEQSLCAIRETDIVGSGSLVRLRRGTLLLLAWPVNGTICR